jgi:hypothetical protein
MLQAFVSVIVLYSTYVPQILPVEALMTMKRMMWFSAGLYSLRSSDAVGYYNHEYHYFPRPE